MHTIGCSCCTNNMIYKNNVFVNLPDDKNKFKGMMQVSDDWLDQKKNRRGLLLYRR